MFAKRRSAHRREIRGTSPGKTLHPAGTVTLSPAAVVNQAVTWAMLSQYNRAEDAPVPVSQYRVMLSSTWSAVRTSPRSPEWSVHAHSFSAIQAHRPAGESVSE